MKARIPNILTIGRVLLAVVVFAALSIYRYPEGNAWALPLALVLFVAAALTDALDGYLARRWNVVSVFGRILDPAADKVLVMGSFVFLASPSFAPAGGGAVVTGVAAWMVVVILARELLVTSVRAVFESAGANFSADWAGKAKMILQSVCIPLVLLLVWLADDAALHAGGWARWAIDISVWLTVAATVVSLWPYLARARTLMRAPEAGAAR